MSDCLIFGAGDFNISAYRRIEDILKNPFIAAADGGYKYAEAAGITPDLIIGDFDSSEKPNGENVVAYPPKKDDTDTMLCIKAGLERNCKRFFLLGETGGRLDHTLANITALNYIADRGARGYIIDETTAASVIRGGDKIILPGFSGYLSLFSLGDSAEGINLSGTEYPLKDGTISNTFPIGVSNRITDKTASIELKKGSLLVMLCNSDF